MLRLTALIFALLSTATLAAQEEAPKNWWNLDLTENSYPGTSADKAQNYLKGKAARTVVVAVIDSGVDIMHEDLKDIIWVNEDEIPGNGKDDDNNGYIDDVNGWNFIGGSDGRNINNENLEVVRIYNRLNKKYANRNVEGLPKKERKEYARMLELKQTIDENREALAPKMVQVETVMDMAKKAKAKIGKDLKDITADDVNALPDADFGALKNIASNAFYQGGTFKDAYEGIEGYYDYINGQMNCNYNPEFDARDIVGDNPANMSDRNYGNNDVKGPDSSHGTHVSGIIAGVRGNGIGIDGVGGPNIRIMSIRTVPNGDERDKDVANAIRYAVDNGAQVINMSFGKAHSPYKAAVDAAIKYAEKKDVLLVHAAGNDGKKLTLTNNYPNDVYLKKGWFSPKSNRVWLEVGAATKMHDEKLPASFSNYNKDFVDVFAPGHDIYSTTPENNYASFNGTSMAAPMVAGIAALVRSYFPDLTARQVREIIMESAIPASLTVVKPGTADEKVSFDRLSQTGAVANAYSAVKMAEMTKGKKKKAGKRDASLMKY